MKIDIFFQRISTVLDDLRSPEHQKIFIENMARLDKQDGSFAEWMMTYLAWSELGSEKDCKNYYWYLEDKDE